MFYQLQNLNKTKEKKPIKGDDMLNINGYSKDDLYKIFLSKIDDLSRFRLESIDTTLSIYKMKYTNLGFILTETSCYNKRIYLKRNQLGFYADERESFKTDESFENYNASVNFLKEHNDEFEIIHNLLKDKESILNGYYYTDRTNETDLEIIVKVLGYGSIREDDIHEENPYHPSEEYKNLISLIERCNDKRNYKQVEKETIDILNNIFKDAFEFRIKLKHDKYGHDFDSEYGILVIDKQSKDMHMLYGVENDLVFKEDLNKYSGYTNYLDVYIKIIIKCIEKQ